jgi:hypothetical protein
MKKTYQISAAIFIIIGVIQVVASWIIKDIPSTDGHITVLYGLIFIAYAELEGLKHLST